MRLYVDGTLHAIGSSVHPTGVPDANRSVGRLGDGLVGLVKDVRIWSVSLDDKQLTQLEDEIQAAYSFAYE